MHWHYIINFYEFFQRIYLIFLEEFIWCVFSPVDARRWVLCVCIYHYLALKKKNQVTGPKYHQYLEHLRNCVIYCYIVLILLSQSWKLLLPDWVSTHSQETMVYHIHHFCLHIIMFRSFPQLILWKLESLTVIILLCLLYFTMCLLFHIHPSAICNIVLLSALKSLKASYLPF